MSSASSVRYFFLCDGHGSTREHLHANSDIAENPYGNIPQVCTYDAYGNPLGFENQQALTDYLYSGEKTDFTGLQYLRDRYLDPRTGRFISFDAYAGNTSDPVSLHKYLYVHADPVQGSDPTGKSLLGLAIASFHSISLRIDSAKTNIAAGGGAILVLRGLENVQRVMNVIIQRRQQRLAVEQRILNDAGQFVGRFRLDILFERFTRVGNSVITQVESKGVPWSAGAEKWRSFLEQLTTQALNFSRGTQISGGVPIEERIIVFSTRIPQGYESRAQEIITKVSQYYDRMFWGLDAFDEFLK